MSDFVPAKSKVRSWLTFQIKPQTLEKTFAFNVTKI